MVFLPPHIMRLPTQSSKVAQEGCPSFLVTAWAVWISVWHILNANLAYHCMEAAVALAACPSQHVRAPSLTALPMSQTLLLPPSLCYAPSQGQSDRPECLAACGSSASGGEKHSHYVMASSSQEKNPIY